MLRPDGSLQRKGIKAVMACLVHTALLHTTHTLPSSVFAVKLGFGELEASLIHAPGHIYLSGVQGLVLP